MSKHPVRRHKADDARKRAWPLAPILLAACLLFACSSFFGKDDPPAAAQGGAPAVQSQALPEGAPAKDGKIPGEDQYLKGYYAAAFPPIATAYQGGNVRAAFYMRIMLQYGLHGQPPNPAEAERAARVMVARYADIQRLAKSGPLDLRPLYHTALAYLSYNALIPGKERDVSLAAGEAGYAVSDGFLPAYNLYAHIACNEGSGILGFLSLSKGSCFSTTSKAAGASDLLAMGNLSYLFREGVGTDKDPMRAANWAHIAANKIPPSPRAQNDMGYFYETGASVTKDLAEAKRYYGLAEARYPLAKRNLERLNKGGAGTPAISNEIDY
ncbi:MAG: hypothetical protein LBF40_07700 [Deltaproteobacteria bacterium]|jgi:TPR repeat protein|nr:hypothetical protein [Deltaproteobacteria bacterium]